jgi:hypothetical protein
LDNEEKIMKYWLVTLASLAAILGVLPAQAQMTIDVGKITCRQYLFDKNISPKAPTVATWLSGYFNGKTNNTVIDIGTVAKNKDKVEDYCRMNQDVTLIEAAQNALGLNK